MDDTEDTGTPGRAVGRRAVLRSLTVGGAVAAAGPLAGTVGAGPASAAGPELWTPPSAAGAPPVDGPHLTFGADPSREMVVSWSTTTPVRRPRALLGSPTGGFGKQVDAETRTYTDGPSGREVYVHHARLRGLRPDRQYVYAAVHDGGMPEMGTFRTAPRGRAPFTFTSFGDQATPTLTWSPSDSGGYSVVPNGIASPAAGDIVAGIEQVGPLFHLLNGDLSYANISQDRVRTWNDFFANNSRSARFRPWMPAAGNHENEKQNGPLGFEAYQARFLLPPNGDDPAFAGLWYAFTAGSVRVVVLQGDEVAYQDAGDTYVHGYSGGRQRQWLEAELRATRADRGIDWVVVCIHQPTISSAAANGPDLGVREQFAPLFDAYEVDLVVCGHDHHYERSLPVRGVVPGSETLTPNPTGSDTSRIDTSTGTVHMVLGGGGTSFNSNTLFYTPARARVITGVGPVGANGKHPSIYAFEDAPWIGFRDTDHAFGFAAFTVDPGTRPGGTTQLQVTYYTVDRPDGRVAPLESFTLYRPRRDLR